MIKAEYVKWIKERGEPGTWGMAKCRAADQLIKQETLRNLAAVLRARSVLKLEADFIDLMVRCHFGSGEVDEFLMQLKAYPDWM